MAAEKPPSAIFSDDLFYDRDDRVRQNVGADGAVGIKMHGDHLEDAVLDCSLYVSRPAISYRRAKGHALDLHMVPGDSIHFPRQVAELDTCAAEAALDVLEGAAVDKADAAVVHVTGEFRLARQGEAALRGRGLARSDEITTRTQVKGRCRRNAGDAHRDEAGRHSDKCSHSMSSPGWGAVRPMVSNRVSVKSVRKGGKRARRESNAAGPEGITPAGARGLLFAEKSNGGPRAAVAD